MAKNRRQKHVLGLSETTADRYKRDVREATKYIETAIVIDKAMVKLFIIINKNFFLINFLNRLIRYFRKTGLREIHFEFSRQNIYNFYCHSTMI